MKEGRKGSAIRKDRRRAQAVSKDERPSKSVRIIYGTMDMGW